jgi:hypothetical protein
VDKPKTGETNFYVVRPATLEKLLRPPAKKLANRPKKDGSKRSIKFRKELPRKDLAWRLNGRHAARGGGPNAGCLRTRPAVLPRAIDEAYQTACPRRLDDLDAMTLASLEAESVGASKARRKPARLCFPRCLRKGRAHQQHKHGREHQSHSLNLRGLNRKSRLCVILRAGLPSPPTLLRLCASQSR